MGGQTCDPSGLETVNLAVNDGVATVELNRPQALNALDLKILSDLETALEAVRDDQSIKVVVLAGAGQSFCTGADLKVVVELLEDWPAYVRYVHRLGEVFRLVETFPIPMLARVHGYALAGGLELVLCCDVAIASQEASIGDQHANFGLIAGAGGIPRLIRRIGKQAALAMLYGGEWLSGDEAAALGIVLKSVPSGELDAAITKFTDTLVLKSRHGLSYTKRAALAGEDVPIVSALNEERAALLEYFSSSPHPREGIEAFLQNRSPCFD